MKEFNETVVKEMCQAAQNHLHRLQHHLKDALDQNAPKFNRIMGISKIMSFLDVMQTAHIIRMHMLQVGVGMERYGLYDDSEASKSWTESAPNQIWLTDEEIEKCEEEENPILSGLQNLAKKINAAQKAAETEFSDPNRELREKLLREFEHE